MDVILLSRLQFAMTICFHFIFPPISIGLAWFLVVAEFKAWIDRDPDWDRVTRLFARLLALTFAMGVATGITMEFQFGTNWASYSRFVGDIFGAPLAAEGIFAFFLESTFLGLYLFGRNRVPRPVHCLSILMVAVGTLLSAFWILTANSWQQTPAGYVIEDGRTRLVDLHAALFSPSLWPRFFHTVDAALMSGVLVTCGVLAFLALRRGDTPAATETRRIAAKALKPAVFAFLVLALLELYPFGHSHATQVALTQPEKFATIEGIEKSGPFAPGLVFGIPVSHDPPKIVARIEIPSLVPLLVYGDASVPVKGLDAFKAEDRPPLILTFSTFHLMVMLGMFFILLGFVTSLAALRGKLAGSRLLLWGLVLSAPLPTLACQLGWITAEVGRQPWVVYHLLRTSEAVSTNVSAGEVLFSIFGFGLLYLLLLVLYLKLFLGRVNLGFPDPEKEEGTYHAS